MHGVFLKSQKWLNLDQLVAIDFDDGIVQVASPQRYPGRNREEWALELAQFSLSEDDLNALWDYLLSVSANLGRHTASTVPKVD